MIIVFYNWYKVTSNHRHFGGNASIFDVFYELGLFLKVRRRGLRQPPTGQEMGFVRKSEKVVDYLKKVAKSFGGYPKSPYLCTRNSEIDLQPTLGYGVMVTLQILVLSFMVRVRVPQQNKPNCFKGGLAFLLCLRKCL